MKKVLLILIAGVLTIGLSAQMLNDFDSNQNITVEGWPNFPNIISNPSATGINTSANCADWQRSTEQWAHIYSNLASPLDFSVNNTFKVKIYSPIVCTVLFKLEVQGSSTFVEILDTCTVANEWVQLSYNFSGIAASGVYDKIVIFPDFATTTDNLFYVDDIEFVQGGSVIQQIDLPLDFESTNVDYTLTDFGGNSTVLGADPVNASNTVAISTKGVGAETWAGTTMGTEAGFATVIPFSTIDTKMNVMVYSPAAGLPVRLKVEEHADPTHSCETEELTTVANAWETIEFDFSDEASGTAALDLSYSYDKASIFFDFGTTGAGDDFYWDNVEFLSTTLGPLTLPITFEDPLVDYTFEVWGGTASELATDPVDPLNTVAMTTKSAGAEWWSGTAPIGLENGLANPIPFTATDTKMHMSIYSPAAGIPILFKVEDKNDNSHACETLDSTTVANGWETIEFDLSNEQPGTPALDLSWTYNKIAIFFGFGDAGAGEVFYWDDIYFGPMLNLTEIDKNVINIYPNPSNGMLNIEGMQNAKSINIYNILGELIITRDLNGIHSASMDISSLSKGIYVLSILNHDNSMITEKIIKE